MRPKIITSLLMLWVALYWLSACSAPTSRATAQTHEAVELLPAWVVKWLENPECSPPCWENIMPGETTILEAKSILAKIPDVRIIGQDDHVIEWKMNDSDYGSAVSKTGDGIITVVILTSVGKQPLLLNRVIDKYGTPEFVHPFDCREGMCEVNIVFPQLGMALDLFVPNRRGQITIEPTSSVINVLFYAGDLEHYRELPENSEGDIQNWIGYGVYHGY